MDITTKTKSSWVEITIKDASTVIVYDLWKSDLIEMKTQLEDALSDIDYMIEKLITKPD